MLPDWATDQHEIASHENAREAYLQRLEVSKTKLYRLRSFLTPDRILSIEFPGGPIPKVSLTFLAEGTSADVKAESTSETTKAASGAEKEPTDDRNRGAPSAAEIPKLVLHLRFLSDLARERWKRCLATVVYNEGDLAKWKRAWA